MLLLLMLLSMLLLHDLRLGRKLLERVLLIGCGISSGINGLLLLLLLLVLLLLQPAVELLLSVYQDDRGILLRLLAIVGIKVQEVG